MNSDIQPTSAEQRISVLVGDRLCVHCGYNLTGQTILRESHYQLLIVRCPECGKVTSVQEYPLLGRWANRWAMLLAGLWLVLLFGLAVGTGAAIFGFSVGIGELSASNYSEFLWAQSNTQAQTWDKDQTLFARAGGWYGALNWDAFWIGIPFTIVAFALGCMWSVMTLGLTSWGRLVVVCVILVIAGAFAMIPVMEWTDANRTGYWLVARRQIALPVMVLSLIYGLTVFGMGLLAGGAITRGLVQLLLPPRLCQSLAILWTSRGLMPPKIERG